MLPLLPKQTDNKHYLASLMVLLAILSLIFPLGLHADDAMTFASPASGRAANRQAITPADVLSRVNYVNHQVELIRKELALPLANEFPIMVTGAQTREVFFQALSANRRVSRMSFERLREFYPESISDRQMSESLPRSYDVWLVVSRTSMQLDKIAEDLDLTKQIKEIEVSADTTPNDVYLALIKLNRQLDTLLQQPFSPSDVFQEVTLGIHYTARLLSKYPVLERIPKRPAFIAGKAPSDVWLLLAECLKTIRSMLEARNEDMILIGVESFNSELVQLGDVYQIASLVVSELNYLYSLETDISPVVPSVVVANKMLPDVYQRAGQLHEQLKTLKMVASNNSKFD